LQAGSLNTQPMRLILCLFLGLILAGCSGSKSGSDGSYSGSVYTVKRGDTLSRISRMTGTSVSELARLNGIKPPYTIEIGQKIKTGGAGKSSSRSSGKTAKVTPSSAVPQSSWPPVGQRCWRWPTSGKVVLPYSTADGGNKGIDIAGSRGQAVYAAGAGKVVYVGNQLRGYGNLIMIKHNEDYITAYAHNETLLVNNGQSVKIGQKIATMGSSDADSVKLHFQIRYRATAIDPIRYLPPQGSKPKC
jgi:Membrane proteins related to metalloendopeptidases